MNESEHCALCNQDGKMQCPLLRLVEEKYHVGREEIMESCGQFTDTLQGKNKKKDLLRVQLIYRICNIGRWLTGGIVLFILIHLIWKQKSTLDFIADHSGDHILVTDIELASSYILPFVLFGVLTIAFYVIKTVMQKSAVD